MIYNSRIVINVTYFTDVWHFGKIHNRYGKIETINWWALRIFHQDYTSTNEKLVDLSNSDTIPLTRLTNLASDVFDT